MKNFKNLFCFEIKKRVILSVHRFIFRVPNGQINFFNFQFLKIEFCPIFSSIQLFSIFKNCQLSKIELVFNL